MPDAWVNFAVVVFVQFLLFIIVAWYAKKLPNMPRLLGWGALIGLVMGLCFDLGLGKLLGLHSYTLGFGAPFLILNGTLSYGLFAATTLLLQSMPPRYFLPWVIVIVAVYEITNHFFRVWAWRFSLPPLEFAVVLLTGYLGGAIIVTVISHVCFRRRVFYFNID